MSRAGQPGWVLVVSTLAITPCGAAAAMAGGDEKKTEELVQAAAKDGTRVMSEVGSIWYNFRGNSEATAIMHSFVAMPGLRGKQVGLPEVRDSGGAWLMFAGTPEAHIMLPGR